MKTISRVLFVIAVVVCFCSCSQTITISGLEGTEIYDGRKQLVGKINSEGLLRTKISRELFTPLMFSKTPSSDLMVPFAIDYKKGKKAMYGGLFCLGFDVTPWGIYSMCMWSSDQGKFNYEYLPNQMCNSDLKFTKPVFREMPVEELAVSSPAQVDSKQKTQKAVKSLKSNAAILAGSYKGKGKLTLDGKLIEEYLDMTVRLTAVERDVVSVKVMDADGLSFFESDDEYTIEKNPDDTFVLTNKTIPSALIMIDAARNLVYNHPGVNIDDGVYTLDISARK